MRTQPLHPHHNKGHRRILMLSVPKKSYLDSEEDMPKYTKSGIRQSALRGQMHNNDIAWPYIRRLIALKRMYRKMFSPERLQKLNRTIEASNATLYSKLASCAMDLKKPDKDLKKSKSWTPTEWKKHMEHISPMAAPKKVFESPPIKRGKPVPLEVLLPRLDAISSRPDFKCYRKDWEEEGYKDPEKVSPSALRYEITERIKKLAEPKIVHVE